MKLVCPRCRRVVGGQLNFFQLQPTGPGLGCPGCGASYPVVDEIPIIFRDLASYLASEGPELLRRQDLPAPIATGLALGAGGCLARNTRLLTVYRNVPACALTRWLSEQVRNAPTPTLEAGCGLGVGAQSIGLDSNIALLRASVCAQKVAGDISDPPFAPGTFGTVVLANLLDSCSDPALALAQAHALLQPGGTLILSCAFAFQDSITPLARQFTDSQLLSGLTGSFFGYPLGFQVLEQTEAEWVLPISDRTEHRHRCLCIRAITPGS